MACLDSNGKWTQFDYHRARGLWNWDNNLDTWIGANSKFSKNYIEGKCAIDKALVGLDDSTKSIIAKMIARSYKEKSKTLYAY